MQFELMLLLQSTQWLYQPKEDHKLEEDWGGKWCAGKQHYNYKKYCQRTIIPLEHGSSTSNP